MSRASVGSSLKYWNLNSGLREVLPPNTRLPWLVWFQSWLMMTTSCFPATRAPLRQPGGSSSSAKSPGSAATRA